MARQFVWEGTALPYPDKINWAYNEISTAESGRTLDGTMHKEVVAPKRKLECTWQTSDDSKTARILSAIKARTFGTLTYPDAMSGGDMTRTFYTGDPSCDSITLMHGILWWTIKVSFIEQ
ncbi:hypothetical protein [Eubacterium barkeri]|uniref:Uncharacterized protein n=1 Tax=Eubacterium barkeri TaxID=1528 RepID=A0A1H3HCS0_EUBBA|nr:hypothetical protein [Eubacterium barkeri]SDY13025.1 hypothetical protein SAMN04488579_11737 [Eubacterium barkeri]